MRILEDRAMQDGLTLRIASSPCTAPTCFADHPFLMLGWEDEDRWCCIDALDDEEVRDGLALMIVDDFDETALMLWSIPWARMSHPVAIAQLSAATFMPRELWSELNEWPDESLSWIFRMRGTDFYTPCALLALTRQYRRDLGGTRGVV